VKLMVGAVDPTYVSPDPLLDLTDTLNIVLQRPRKIVRLWNLRLFAMPHGLLVYVSHGVFTILAGRARLRMPSNAETVNAKGQWQMLRWSKLAISYAAFVQTISISEVDKSRAF
jgi:hypothetical protein